MIAIRTTTVRFALLALSLAVVTACGGGQPEPASRARMEAATEIPSEAIAHVGDITIHASAIQTSMLDPGIAGRYGITRDARTVLLLVAIRQGTGADALPAEVTAHVTDLRGSRQQVDMRALHSGDTDAGTDTIDYIGTVGTGLPDTLRFEVEVQPEGVATTILQLSRDFYPQ
jgi:hypothetical protein